MQTAFDLDAMAAAVLVAFPKLDTLEQRLSLELYRMLAEGRPVVRATLARRLGVPGETVARILARWRGVFSDADRRIVGYWGLALPSAYDGPHRFAVGGQTLSAWCAWDTLFLPELLGRAAEVESSSPDQGGQVRMTVTAERVTRVAPADACMSFLLPDAAAVEHDVVTRFCHFVHFFASRRAGERWTARHSGTFILPIDDAHAVARRKNAAQYRDALH